ncbi:unnamed protein product [Moneuplotes crassus]|uniref:Uncharacterized protein n=1 Tax=Euplotes crassus TaxID=5936 RepID=A0AAD1XDK4_EUPCR|nr:unnamed protein product [Moneuplotes crassus]
MLTFYLTKHKRPLMKNIASKSKLRTIRTQPGANKAEFHSSCIPSEKGCITKIQALQVKSLSQFYKLSNDDQSKKCKKNKKLFKLLGNSSIGSKTKVRAPSESCLDIDAFSYSLKNLIDNHNNSAHEQFDERSRLNQAARKADLDSRMSFKNYQDYIEEEKMRVNNSIYFKKRPRSLFKGRIPKPSSKRYFSLRQSKKIDDKKIIIVMSKSKQTRELQTQTKEELYNFKSNNEGAYHSKIYLCRGNKLKTSQSYSSFWVNPVQSTGELKIERCVKVKPPSKQSLEYTAKKRKNYISQSNMQFISPAVLHQKEPSKGRKPLSSSLFNYLKAMKNRRNIRFVKVNPKISTKLKKNACTQNHPYKGPLKLESDVKENWQRLKNFKLEIDTRAKKLSQSQKENRNIPEKSIDNTNLLIDTIDDGQQSGEWDQVFGTNANSETFVTNLR